MVNRQDLTPFFAVMWTRPGTLMAGSENRTNGGVRPCGISLDTKINTASLPSPEEAERMLVEINHKQRRNRDGEGCVGVGVGGESGVGSSS